MKSIIDTDALVDFRSQCYEPTGPEFHVQNLLQSASRELAADPEYHNWVEVHREIEEKVRDCVKDWKPPIPHNGFPPIQPPVPIANQSSRPEQIWFPFTEELEQRRLKSAADRRRQIRGIHGAKTSREGEGRARGPGFAEVETARFQRDGIPWRAAVFRVVGCCDC